MTGGQTLTILVVTDHVLIASVSDSMLVFDSVRSEKEVIFSGDMHIKKEAVIDIVLPSILNVFALLSPETRIVAGPFLAVRCALKIASTSIILVCVNRTPAEITVSGADALGAAVAASDSVMNFLVSGGYRR
jgi:hypothetical protein